MTGRETHRRIPGLLWATLLLVAVVPAGSFAKERAKKVRQPVVDRPVLIINAASVERLLNQAVFAFEEGGRPELAETMGVGLAKVNDLKGLDRGQSMGLLVFLPGIVPQTVAYVPVKNIDEMLKTLEIGQTVTKKVGESQYEIISGARKWHMLVRNGYAFVAESKEALDHDLGDPAVFAGKLSKTYDLGAQINLGAVSQITRDIFTGTFRAKAESDLQRRDNEPVAAHRVRRAVGMQRLEFLEQLLTQGEHVTLGLSLSQADKSAALELQITARSGSDFATTLSELKGTRSRFANLLAGRPPLTAAVSLKLDKPNQKLWHEIVSAQEIQLLERVGAPADGSGEAGASVRDFMKVFQSTVDGGFLDAFAQFVGRPPGPFVLVGGVRVTDSTQSATALRGLMQGFRSAKDAPEIQMAALVHRGIEFHRMQMQQDQEKLYGGKPSLYVGAGESIVWFAIGCDGATAELKRAVDSVSEPVRDVVQTSPFQFAMNLSDWFEILDPKKRSSLARKALVESKDTLRVDLQGVGEGARLRVRFDEGFIRLVGLRMVEAAERWQHQQEAAAAAKKPADPPEENK